MKTLEEKLLDKLSDSGLFVSQPMSALGGGMWVLMPSTKKGHYIPDFESSFIALEGEPEPPESNAPMIGSYSRDSAWVVDINGLGKSSESTEFYNEWATPEEAIEDILDFYLGDSSRMIELAFSHGKSIGLAK